MGKVNSLLKKYLEEQIGLEENLFKVIEQQIAEIDDTEFADAKRLLTETKQVLERHYVPLNKALDQLEKDADIAIRNAADNNGHNGHNGHNPDSSFIQNKKRRLISRLLRDNYSALNLVTMGNTLLYTTALALGCQEVASIALKHLENLAPLVVKIGELLPDVATRELRSESAEVDLAIAQLALKNTQAVWRTLS